MASANGNNELHVRVVSRRLVKASDTSTTPHVLAVSNLDLIPQSMPISMFCIYPRPPTGDFTAIIAAFETGLPSLLNHFFPFAGRIATNPSSGVPEFHCNNQGAELLVGEASAALASLDYATVTASVRRVQQPYADGVALSVQVVSFECGGFAVAWCTNHVLADGKALSLLVSAWSELARTGALSAGARPNHDRSMFRPRAPPSYSDSFNKAFTPVHAERQVNVLTAEQSFVERLYYIEAPDIDRLREAASRDGAQRATRVQAVAAYIWKALAGVVGAADTRCRMEWWVDGRPRLTTKLDPELHGAMRNYIGNVTTFAIREASVDDLQRMALTDVAAIVREAITAPAYDEHFQELVDWVEDHKTERHIETASLGLGSPTVSVSAFTSFPLDTDFGFGSAAMAMPTTTSTVRLCGGFVQMAARPGGDGSWITSAFLWPRLAAALESDEPCIFKPVTAEYLGLSASQVSRSRL
ncbi:unnamed protein product [Urochloa decumbens]|uniref:Uncharacterized protein n=1 Tax=Urochloa decumbens TaxID=240449 RepID=A0ABC8ZMB1_9POAL